MGTCWGVQSQRPVSFFGKRDRERGNEERSVLGKRTFFVAALRGRCGEYRSGARYQAAARPPDDAALPFPAVGGGCDDRCLVRGLGSTTTGYGSRGHLRRLSLRVAGRFLCGASG